jgi:GNAT superfamily N-acetyltransferase
MKKESDYIDVRIAGPDDEKFARIITNEMELSARLRGSGISKRSPFSIITKMREGKAVIAVTASGTWAGFSYIEVWRDGAYVSNSGLIVAPAFRLKGVARQIKKRVFELSRQMYPDARIFSITTGAAIMKMNSRLGFEPVSFNEIPGEKKFWDGCKSCVNYCILKSKEFHNCLCTAMLYIPKTKTKRTEAT